MLISIYILLHKRKNDIQKITAQAPNLNANVLSKALLAYDHARLQGLDKQKMLTVIDYDMPDTAKRLWVINMNNDTVEYNTLVAQGKNTGLKYAKHFSNKDGSDETSIGVFLTGVEYTGDHAHSMRLHGLEKGFNNNAFKRAVVMHGAWYVSPKFVKAHGYLGRSWGCTALNQKIEPQVVDAIKDGTIMVSYASDQKWLQTSAYLKPLTAESTVNA